MRIGVDVRTVSQHKGGMAVYAKTLLATLKQQDKKNEYVLLTDQPQEGWIGKHKLRWVFSELYWSQIRLLNIFKQKKLDLGFFLNPPVPFLLNTPLVLTIPDMAFIYDSGISVWIKAYLFTMYFVSAHKATLVITFSFNSKADISKLLKLKPTKIVVTPLAAAKTISRQSEAKVKTILAKLRIHQPYILAVPGTFLLRKNISDLLLAFKDITSKFLRNHQLVIVGITSGKNFMAVKQQTQKLGLQSQVVFTGRLPDSELAALYTGATLFVCTSLYEGFGLPVLEAMKCGTPVISYNNSSLPEVVGDAGILVNNVDELSFAMQNVLKNKKLHDKLGNLGLKRAADYTWKRTALDFIHMLAQSVV